MSSSQKFIRRKIARRRIDTRGANPYFPKEQPSFLQQYGETLLSILLVFIALIYWIFFSGYFTITEVVITGNENITNEHFLTTFREIQDHKKFFVLPQNNILFFSKKTAMAKIQESYALDELAMAKKYPHTITVTIKERIPGMIYQNGEQRFYTDREGNITGRVLTEEQDGRFPVIVDLNERTVGIREHVLSKKTTEFFLELMDIFPEHLPLTPINGELAEVSCSKPVVIEEEITLPPTEKEKEKEKEKENEDSAIKNEPETKTVKKTVEQDIDCDTRDMQNQITIVTEEGVRIHFTTLDDMALQLKRLDILIAEQLDNNVAGLQYIDLRFGNKIYYQ